MLQPSWPSSCRLTRTPTFIVGQTKSGPLAGQGFVSSKLAAEPGVAVTPATSTTKMMMSANRFTVVAPILTFALPGDSVLRNRDGNPFEIRRAEVGGDSEVREVPPAAVRASPPDSERRARQRDTSFPRQPRRCRKFGCASHTHDDDHPDLEELED